jgi:hypothetical protein
VQYLVTYEQPRVNHVLHLLLTLVTFGLWLIVWIIVAIYASAAAPVRKITAVYDATNQGHPDVLRIPLHPARQKQSPPPRRPAAPLTPIEQKRKQLGHRIGDIAFWGFVASVALGAICGANFSPGIGWGIFTFVLIVAGIAAGSQLWQRHKLTESPEASDRNA